ncbi:hypothetical protein [Myxococcus sp. RHSTA-1-4]|uniref:hypothetical protein n=1 Tax=Myxococcus sp. RHSTA-1-4 TaxID=2874601 RepID=UPI001CBC957D|nr:hypothetical protein [Myxococcus sp. RHSTA-1-4]MBZ4415756.1 hypothetical protein [Myxococcus sp. RHSTA-1-4]
MPDERPASTPPEPAAEPSNEEARSPEDERIRLAAYDVLLQSTAKVVEDTSEQLRQLASLSTAASGVALRMMLTGDKPGDSARAMAEAQRSLQEAMDVFQRIGRVSIQLMERFQPVPSSPPAPPSEPAPDDEPGRKP